MTTPDTLIAELMDRVRHELYKSCPGKWFSQQQMVKRALTYPASWLAQRQVEIPAYRYKAILDGIIDGILANGELQGVAYYSRYFYTCVQRHMAHHGDEYYREGVAIRNRVGLTMSAIEKAHKGADSTVPVLDRVHATLVSHASPPAHMKPAADPLQPDLFGSAKPRQRG